MRAEINTYASTIMSVVDKLLVKGSTPERPETAWIVGTRIDINNYHSDEESNPFGGFLYVACFAPMNYVHVLAAFSDRPKYERDLAGLEWQPIACHDSCWRDDGLRSTIQNAHKIIVKAALAGFNCDESKLSSHVALDLLLQVDAPREVLRSGLEKPERHGRLVIPQYAIHSVD